MVSNYDVQFAGKGWNAFPCYLSLYDDTWHKVEIIYNSNGSSGSNVLKCLLDGMELRLIDNGITAGIGMFESVLLLGGDGVTIRNYRFENNVTKSSEPSLVVYMLHAITDGLHNTSNVVKTSIGRLQDIIDANNKIGSKYVSLEDVDDFIHRGKTLPDNCYTIIHDDYYYLADTNDPTVNKFRKLYNKYKIRPSFALIMTQITDLQRTSVKLDNSIYSFHIHDYDHLRGLAQRTYNDLVNNIDSALDSFRENFWASTVITQVGGSNDQNVIKILKHKGVSLSFAIGSTTLSRRYNNLALPRVDASDRVNYVYRPNNE